MQISPKVFPLRPLVGWGTRTVGRIADNRFMRRRYFNSPLRARGPGIMLRTIDEHCVEDQMATEQTDTQRARHSAQGVTEGTARFDSATSTDIRIGKVIDARLAATRNFGPG